MRIACLGCLALAGLLSVTVACSRRGTGDLNVDEVQAQANSVEKQLRAMRTALRAKDIQAAEERHAEARETLQEHRASLAAYPEAAELEAAVTEAGRSLCYHAVSLTLEGVFERVRAKELDEARARLERARAEHDRCEGQIRDREDYLPLKMNLDTAPQALVELERELARPALLARMSQVLQGLEQKKAVLQAKLAALEKQPNQRELAIELDAQLKTLRQELSQSGDFTGEPEWLQAAAALSGSLDELDRKRAALVRRGKLLLVAGDELVAADRVSVQAVTAKDKQAARKMLAGALATYRQGLGIVEGLLAEEPGLARYPIRYKGGKRNGAWLKGHLAKSARTVERMLARLSGQKAPPPAKPKPSPKPKKKSKRRIQRW